MILELALAFAVLPAPAPLPTQSTDGLDRHELQLAATPGAAGGAAAAFEWTVEREGVLFLHARSKELDPRLEVHVDGADEPIASDDDGGGGTHAFVTLDVAAGTRVRAVVRGDRAGAAALLVGLALESGATKDAASEALAVLRGVRPGTPPEEVHEELLAQVARLDAVEGADGSRHVEEARSNLALRMERLGDPVTAIRLHRQVIGFRRMFFPEGHLVFLYARGNLANALRKTSDLEGAEREFRAVSEGFERLLPPGHDLLLQSWINTSHALVARGKIEAALELNLRVISILDVPERQSSPLLTAALMNAGAEYGRLGEPRRAAELFERVRDIYATRLRPDDPRMERLLFNLAGTRMVLDDFVGARPLLERSIELREQQQIEGSIDIERARMQLGSLCMTLGDYVVAIEELEESVPRIMALTGADSSDANAARTLLAEAYAATGRREEALELYELILEETRRLRPDDRRRLRVGHHRVALANLALDRVDEARRHVESAMELAKETARSGDPTLSGLRRLYARLKSDEGYLEEDQANVERWLQEAEREFGPDHPATGSLLIQHLWGAATLGDEEALREDWLKLARSTIRTMEDLASGLSAREAEVASQSVRESSFATLFSCLVGEDGLPRTGAFATALFEAVESVRGVGLAALRGRRLLSAAGPDPARDALQREVHLASSEVARWALSVDGDAPLREAVLRRGRAERALRQHVRARLDALSPRRQLEAQALSRRLAPDEVAVGYWGYTSLEHAPSGVGSARSGRRRLGAFVLRPDATVAFVDLGPLADVESAAGTWRAALGSGEGELAAGAALARLLLDPLAEHVAGAARWHLALDHPLHVVPFDALPLGAGREDRLGDRTRVLLHVSLSELLSDPEDVDAARSLFAIGDVDYGAPESSAPRPAAAARGGVWELAFESLPATRAEVETVRSLFEQVFGEESPARVLRGSEADREALVEAAPGSRFVHLATHGWFAPESFRALDVRPATLPTGNELDLADARGLASMALAGLALAGANEGADEDGRLPSVITAEELSALDLSGCELAVLSACETHLGLGRAGQGLDSLQKALHAAGARATLTSLWSVPDDATRELMEAFYRNLWVEQQPADVALWNAKRALRERRAPLRDWAGWVLTGTTR